MNFLSVFLSLFDDFVGLVLNSMVDVSGFYIPLLFAAAYFNLKDSGVAAEKLNDLSFTEDVSSDFKEISQLHHGKRDYREVVIETYSQGN